MRNKQREEIHYSSLVRRLTGAWFVTCLFLAVFLSSTGCKSHYPDPLKGWRLSHSQDPNKLDKAIRDDYQQYIQDLPTKERINVGPIQFFEDAIGQHAVRILVANNRTDWAHVLIYDQANKRVKLIKYVSGRYLS